MAKRKVSRPRIVDDDDDDLPPPPGVVEKPPAWDCKPIAKQVQAVLDAVEAPPINRETRLTLQRYLYRRNKYGEMFRDDDFVTDGRGYVTLLCRTILESEGNQGALIEPIVSAVAASMRTIWIRRGVEWIAAFDKIPLLDILSKLRELDLFTEKEIAHHYEIGIERRLWRIFGPDVVPAAPKPKAQPKPPRAVTRIPAIEKKIALGLQLLDVQSKVSSNIELARLRRKLGVEPVSAQEAMRVAGIYGRRPEIYRNLTWMALVELSSPSLPADARTEFESKIVAGSRFTHTQIRARRPLKKPPRMAA